MTEQKHHEPSRLLCYPACHHHYTIWWNIKLYRKTFHPLLLNHNYYKNLALFPVSFSSQTQQEEEKNFTLRNRKTFLKKNLSRSMHLMLFLLDLGWRRKLVSFFYFQLLTLEEWSQKGHLVEFLLRVKLWVEKNTIVQRKLKRS